MKVLRAFKTELDPNNAQRTLLSKTAGCARFAWNWGLARRIAEYKAAGKSSNAIEQHKQLNALKAAEFPWMYEVSKCAPQEALRDLDDAYAAFFRRVKAGEKPGFPRFKSKHRSKPSFRISSRIGVSNRTVNIPRVGWVRLKERGYVPRTGLPGQRQLSTTVTSEGGRWFVSVQCEHDEPEVQTKVNRSVGIDVGLNTFAVTSDGERIEHPKLLKKMLRRLRRLQRKVSRRAKGGANRRKAVRAISTQYYKVACRRRDFIHKATSGLVKTKPDAKFVIEDLNVKDMMGNRKLARSIGDSGWGEFVRQLTYKAGDERVIKANRWFPSSKMCSQCGYVMDSLPLDVREWTCPQCFETHDRDRNAAVNLSKYEQYVVDGVYRPQTRRELPPVRREVTPAESAVCRTPRRSRNQTPYRAACREIKG